MASKNKTIEEIAKEMSKALKRDKVETFDQAALNAAQEVANLVSSKQHDYGQDNILRAPYGVEQGIVTRLSDKLWRLKNLTSTGNTPNNESLTDTADDIIGYGLVLKMYLDGTFSLPLENKAGNAPTLGACNCMTCSGYCSCKLPGHHTK